ncbi:MAG: cysteine hydrolase family protein [Comamonas sp.]
MPRSTALLVIDAQTALFAPAPRPWEANAVLQRIKLLAASARTAGLPVVWVQHADEHSMQSGSPGWQLVQGLQAEPADYRVEKRTPDAFLHTPLQELLTALQAEQLVVAGYASEFCVDTTVRRAAALGWDVMLAADAHTTHDKPHASAQAIRAHENATLPAIRSFDRRIQAVNTADLCALIQDDAAADITP